MIEIRTGNIPCQLFISDVNKHLIFKKWFIDYLSKSIIFSSSDRNEGSIFNSDFFIPTFHNEYHNIVFPIINDHTLSLSSFLGYVNKPLQIENFWFQQYKKGDSHTWHRHGSIFSNVYYVDLPEDSSKTSFRFRGEEFEVDVKEGQILTFPSYLEHCSKPNLSDKIKTVIAFNST